MRLIARTIEMVRIDYQQLITAQAARWLQNNNEHFSVSKLHGPYSCSDQRLARPIVISMQLPPDFCAGPYTAHAV